MSNRKKSELGGDGKKPVENRRDRDSSGRFARGNRANPDGRPKGCRNQTTLLVEELLANEAETLTRSLIRLAKAGNAPALSLVFARLAPPRKDRPLEMRLPPVVSTKDVAAAHGVLLRELGVGAVSPSEACAVAQLLELQRRALEATELESRLTALEARLAAPKEKL